jgi:hypothetical protein
MKYCDVLYAGDLDYGEVHVESAMPYISQCNIMNSSHDGIYCSGSTFILDSSFVSNNNQYGLYFNQFTQVSCGLLINGDTMKNNGYGGLFLGTSNYSSCSTEIKNCYFISNSYYGAINDSATLRNVNIHNNYFLNNTSNIGIVSFSSGINNYLYFKIEDNYFSGNNSTNHIVWTNGYPTGAGGFVNIRKNYFINNISSNAGIIGFVEELSDDSISCNTFIGNQTRLAVIYLSNTAFGSSGIIQHNIFDGNSNISSNGTGILEVSKQLNPRVLDFSNNIVRNNTTVGGRLCHIVAYLSDSIELLKIYHNEFHSNTSNKIISITGPLINNSSLDFMYFKHNNFLDASNEYTLYDSIPYGSPNILADSNYWGSTSTQHVDSVIFDYFDFAAQSVVYYSPILSDLNTVDTVCPTCNLFSLTGNVVTNVSCYGANNGIASVTSSGGNPPFTYTWSPAGGYGQTASNLAPGTYTCSVTCSFGCPTFTSVTITQPPVLTVVQCPSTNVSCYGGNNGCVCVVPGGGTPPYTYMWLPNIGNTASICGLAASNYSVIVFDANACPTNISVSITQPPQLTANTSTLVNVSCFNGNNGTARVTAGGGIAPYTYLWSPSGGNGAIASNLTAGNYTVTVTDANGCTRTSTTIVTQPTLLTESINVTNASCSACSDGSAAVIANGGVAPYTYLWTPVGGNGATASNLPPGNYTCCVTDAHGCTICQSDSVSYPTAINEIFSHQNTLIIIPNPAHNTFTLSLNNQSSINNSQLTIYDVTGRVVHEQKIHSQLSTVNCTLSAGVYFVRVEAGDKMYQQKLVIE